MKKIITYLIVLLFLVNLPSVLAGERIDQSKKRYKDFMPALETQKLLSLDRIKKTPEKSIAFERAKIDFLLESTLKSGFEYERNNIRYDAERTVNHLRKKYRKRVREIKTAEDFINQIATRSEATVKPYLAIPGNGYFYYTSDLLFYRLQQLENFLNSEQKF